MLTCFHDNNNIMGQSDPYVSLLLRQATSDITTGGQGGQSAPLIAKNSPKIGKKREKNQAKMGKRGKKREKIRKKEGKIGKKEEKSGSFFHFAPPDR